MTTSQDTRHATVRWRRRHRAAMRRALALAARGPATGQNPQVGCVILSAAGDTLAEGWHRGAGTPHAEVDALSKLAPGAGARRDGGRHPRAVQPHRPHRPVQRGAHRRRRSPASSTRVSDPDPGRRRRRGAAARTPASRSIGGVLRDEAADAHRATGSPPRGSADRTSPLKWASSLDGRGRGIRRHEPVDHRRRGPRSTCTSSAPRPTRSWSAPAPCSPTTRRLTARGADGELLAAPADARRRRRAPDPGGRALFAPPAAGRSSRAAATSHADPRRTVRPRASAACSWRAARRSPARSSPPGSSTSTSIYLAPTLLGGAAPRARRHRRRHDRRAAPARASRASSASATTSSAPDLRPAIRASTHRHRPQKELQVFTGIIEELGEVIDWEPRRRRRPAHRARPARRRRMPQHGDSISVSGVCLTVVDARRRLVHRRRHGRDDRHEHPRRRSRPGARVNLERAAQVGDRLGGHIVQGHIDGTSTAARDHRRRAPGGCCASASPASSRRSSPARAPSRSTASPSP